MLATELIDTLTALVQAHGDGPVVGVNAGGSGDIDIVRVAAVPRELHVGATIHAHEFQLLEHAWQG